MLKVKRHTSALNELGREQVYFGTSNSATTLPHSNDLPRYMFSAHNRALAIRLFLTLFICDVLKDKSAAWVVAIFPPGKVRRVKI